MNHKKHFKPSPPEDKLYKSITNHPQGNQKNYVQGINFP